ncbi:MAG: hypothetical protein MR936_00145 [Eubacterium sp.]|nr:hypothetical protein [Eubacterium sp.]
MNKVTNLYRSFFQSRETDIDADLVYEFVKQVSQTDGSAFDLDVVSQYIENPQFVEQTIIESILETQNLDLDVNYLSVYTRQMNATGIALEEDKAVVVDELLTYTALSFFLTVFSLAYDSGIENFTRCIKNCIVLLDLQGKKHEIGVHSLKDIDLMISLPPNIIHLAMDSFWTAWTFIIGHELYHIKSKNSGTSSLQEELDADAYGYKVLIGMIEAQKQKRIPTEISIFYEDYYLSPVMLFEYYCFLDLYRSLCGETVEYTDYPSPQQRQEQLFCLFDSIPDDFHTEVGNELLNHFLNVVEILKEQIVLKKKLSKLEIPAEEKLKH